MAYGKGEYGQRGYGGSSFETDGPSLTASDPVNGASGVHNDDLVSFTIESPAGLDLNLFNVDLDGVQVIVGGLFQSGFGGTIVQDPETKIVVNITTLPPLSNGLNTVNIGITDLAGLSPAINFAFTVSVDVSETLTIGESLDDGFMKEVPVGESLTLTEQVTTSQTQNLPVSETLVIGEDGEAATAQVVVSDRLIEITFDEELRFDGVETLSNFSIESLEAGAYPVEILSVEVLFDVLQTGSGGLVIDDSGPTERTGTDASTENTEGGLEISAPSANFTKDDEGKLITLRHTDDSTPAPAQGNLGAHRINFVFIDADPEAPSRAFIDPTIQVSGFAGMTWEMLVEENIGFNRQFSQTIELNGTFTVAQIGDYIDLRGGTSPSEDGITQIQAIVEEGTPGTVRVSKLLSLVASDNGSIDFKHTSGVQGLRIHTTKMTDEGSYSLSINNLKAKVTGDSKTIVALFQGDSPKPRVESIQFLPEEGSIVVTYDQAMRSDDAIANTGEYSLTPPPAEIISAAFISPTAVALQTTGLSDGNFTLTVNASGTPKDIAGNPLDPTFNTAVFASSVPLTIRSIFTDKGPIAKPVETLQSGTSATLDTFTEVTLPGALLIANHVGLFITLSGGSINGGDFRITSVLSPTRARLRASFTLPDAASGSLDWVLFDPRNGQIADDPLDVVVRINGFETAAESVIGLLGQIVMTTAPLPTDDVQVDYSHICNPVLDVRRLNSKEFRLNAWNRDRGFPADLSQHKYRYNNTLVEPETFIAGVGAILEGGTLVFSLVIDGTNDVLRLRTSSAALFGTYFIPQTTYTSLTNLIAAVNLAIVGANVTARLNTIGDGLILESNTKSTTSYLENDTIANGSIANTALALTDGQSSFGGEYTKPASQLDQPQERELHYRAYERAYTAVLNEPNLLLLNTPKHKIAFPPSVRTLSEEFILFEGLSLPENDISNPWERVGTGTVTQGVGVITVEDDVTGGFPTGQPVFWTRNLDLSFEAVFALSWRFSLDLLTTPEGVWTGVAAGYSDERVAFVVGFLDDGGTKKVGILKRGSADDPTDISAWTGGIDGSGNPTDAPVDFDWSTIHTYRIFRAASGVVTLFFDGEVVASMLVTEAELPFKNELNAAFDDIQGVFWGSLSRPAENTSTWDFVRYLTQPLQALQTSPSSFVSYEANVVPENDAKPWTPVGFHGTSLIQSTDFLLLDATSATDVSITDVGLLGGDFLGYVRLEPLLSRSSEVVIDVGLQVLTYTHGVDADAIMVAVDDGTRLMQLSFLPAESAPKLSYGGRSLPEDFSPFVWSSLGAETGEMAGRILRVTDAASLDGKVYFIDDVAPGSFPGPLSDDRVIDTSIDYTLEFRAKVTSFTADPSGFVGTFAQAFDGTRAVGVYLLEIAGTKYVAFTSDGADLGASARFAFNWDDGEFHTYRAVKNTAGDAVSLFVDATFVGIFAYSSFTAPPPLPTGQLSFGSSTPASTVAESVVEWAYCNAWRVDTTVDRYVGIWKGFDEDSLTGYFLPTKVAGNGFASGNTLGDSEVDLVAAGVNPLDRLVVDDGPNKGVYRVDAVTGPTSLNIQGTWPFAPTTVNYRIIREVNWAAASKYRLARDSSGEVILLQDTNPEPLIRVGYNSLPLRNVGIVKDLSGGLPAIAFGAFDQGNLSQTRWDFVRYGITRSPNELRIVPHHEFLNQWNVMHSPERLRTTLPHEVTDFKSSSTGIVPKKDPDFLADPGLLAFTLLNEGTPLVPSTQTFEVRAPYPTEEFVSALNRPEDVLNNDGDFVLNDSGKRFKLVVPDDVLYNCLDVIEQIEGETDLIAPFDDECQPTIRGFQYTKEVCLEYEGDVLPEADAAAPTPWVLQSDTPGQVSASTFSSILTYSTGVLGSRTVYRNDTPLPDAPSLITETRFRLKLLNDSTAGTGDSQVRFGLSAPGMTLALAFITTPLAERFVLVLDQNTGAIMGSQTFDYLDGAFHDYRIVRDPGLGKVQIFIDS